MPIPFSLTRSYAYSLKELSPRVRNKDCINMEEPLNHHITDVARFRNSVMFYKIQAKSNVSFCSSDKYDSTVVSIQVKPSQATGNTEQWRHDGDSAASL